MNLYLLSLQFGTEVELDHETNRRRDGHPSLLLKLRESFTFQTMQLPFRLLQITKAQDFNERDQNSMSAMQSLIRNPSAYLAWAATVVYNLTSRAFLEITRLEASVAPGFRRGVVRHANVWLLEDYHFPCSSKPPVLMFWSRRARKRKGGEREHLERSLWWWRGSGLCPEDSKRLSHDFQELSAILPWVPLCVLLALHRRTPSLAVKFDGANDLFSCKFGFAFEFLW